MDSTGEVEQVIQTARLRLVTLVPAVMEAILAGDFETAGSLAGYEIVTGFEAEAAFFNLRQQHLREDPEAVEIGYTIYEAYRRRGFAEEAAAIGETWARGDREAAAAAVSNELIDATAIAGTAADCRAKIAAYRDSSLDLPILSPFARGANSKAVFEEVIRACAPEA